MSLSNLQLFYSILLIASYRSNVNMCNNKSYWNPLATGAPINWLPGECNAVDLLPWMSLCCELSPYQRLSIFYISHLRFPASSNRDQPSLRTFVLILIHSSQFKQKYMSLWFITCFTMQVWSVHTSLQPTHLSLTWRYWHSIDLLHPTFELNRLQCFGCLSSQFLISHFWVSKYFAEILLECRNLHLFLYLQNPLL